MFASRLVEPAPKWGWYAGLPQFKMDSHHPVNSTLYSGWPCAIHAYPIVRSIAVHETPSSGINVSLPVQRLSEWVRRRRESERLLEVTSLSSTKCIGGERNEHHRAAAGQQIEPLPIVG